MVTMKFTYLYDTPKRYAFERENFRNWTESHCKGSVLNLFSGRTKLDIPELRIDNDEKAKADIYIDAMEFLKTTNLKFDTIILDPSEKIRMNRIKFKERHEFEYEIYKNAIVDLLNDDGIVITVGYDSVGMGSDRGFEKIEICLVCHSAGQKDLIALIEQKKIKTLNSFF